MRSNSRWIIIIVLLAEFLVAVKMGTVWLIPKSAKKPLDGRRKFARQKGEKHCD